MNIIEKSIHLRHLNRQTKMYIGVPSSPPKALLVMHDGQNIFEDEKASYEMAWRVHEKLKESGLDDWVVLGIACASGTERLNEYAPFPIDFKNIKKSVTGGKGDLYLKDLVEDVIPDILKTYFNHQKPDLTTLMGSSMGGIISLYGGFIYPEVFDQVASLSGAYYVSLDAFKTFLSQSFEKTPKKIYLDVGDMETGINDPSGYLNAHEVIKECLMKHTPKFKFKSAIIKGGVHNEIAWRNRLNQIFKYLK
jgi:predicted alpha/beta superfamily hydrolase